MLNRELFRYTRKEGRLHPRFLDPENHMLRNLVGELLAIYQTGIGQSREELMAAAHAVVMRHRSIVVAKGLHKLVLDRCQFQEASGEEEIWRQQIFLAAVPLLQQANLGNYEQFIAAMSKKMATSSDELSKNIFADLPIRQPLLSAPTQNEEDILFDYNLELIQGLLFWSTRIELEIPTLQVGLFRHFFRKIKFFRLIPKISQKEQGKLVVEVAGPLSMFEQTRKYGMNLAYFFHTITTLKEWRLLAPVNLPDQSSLIMEVDHHAPLRPKKGITSGYQPKEFELFAISFKEMAQDWSLEEEVHLLNFSQGEWVVPDFSFRHAQYGLAHLELFHPWHEGAIMQRLLTLESSPNLSFMIGIDRQLAKKPAVALRLKQSPWFNKHGFLFNDIPPVKRVLQTLNQLPFSLDVKEMSMA